ncbi:MAG TPA: FlgD immunoglobulin-like domain containing protein, partial [Candidatus Krumholzibacteria bacterium]|nr:FlgD immunoglobulin-like domain containing protein [Candidatus Krumholzibacteria bacterium]
QGQHGLGAHLAGLQFYPTEVDPVELQAGKVRAQAMLTLAATLEVTADNRDGRLGVNVRVTNETGHKLPSGYPEGRRSWLNVKAFDAGDNLVYESGAYDAATGELVHDADAKIYHIEPGISTRLAGVLGLEAGPSFHFALNDTVYLDNRIPPRGFTNAAFTAVQSPPVAYAYADGQYWDDTHYTLPDGAVRVEAVLWYQTTSKEYVEFLRDNNTVDDMGQRLYDAWATTGRSAPVAMAQQAASLDLTGAGDAAPRVLALAQNYPNPFNPQTFIAFTLPADGKVTLRIYDARGRLVRTLADGMMESGSHRLVWDGADDGGRASASGVYHCVLKAGGRELQRKMTLLR